MRVYFHNFNPLSNSGPNKFTRQMVNTLVENKKIKISKDQNEADAEFALIQLTDYKKKPTILRLDGIYFNTRQDFKSQNSLIEYSYKASDRVVFQSEFNKKLTEHWFGFHSNSFVIHNCPDMSLINSIQGDKFDDKIDNSIEVWSCASSWRPHKRLGENLRYFCENSPKDSIMLVAGADPNPLTIKKYSEESKGRVFYVGELDYHSLLSLYKRSTTFVHLAYLDHCPNVVVDAQAAGCRVVCASSGGTPEIVYEGNIIEDKGWDFSPIDLYDPPKLNFEKVKKVSRNKKPDTIVECSNYYFDIMKEMLL